MTKYHGKSCVKCGSTLRYVQAGKIGDCVQCTKDRMNSAYKSNPEKLLSRNRNWRRRNREKRNASERKWYASNRDAQLERGRVYRKNNPEKGLERTRRWIRENPEKKQAARERYRALKQNAKSEPYDFKDICRHYGSYCLKCRKQKKLTIDHIIPLSKGGDDVANNIQPLCFSCNSSKGARHIDYRSDTGPSRWIQQNLLKRRPEATE